MNCWVPSSSTARHQPDASLEDPQPPVPGGPDIEDWLVDASKSENEALSQLGELVASVAAEGQRLVLRAQDLLSTEEMLEQELDARSRRKEYAKRIAGARQSLVGAKARLDEARGNWDAAVTRSPSYDIETGSIDASRQPVMALKRWILERLRKVASEGASGRTGLRVLVNGETVVAREGAKELAMIVTHYRSFGLFTPRGKQSVPRLIPVLMFRVEWADAGPAPRDVPDGAATSVEWDGDPLFIDSTTGLRWLNAGWGGTFARAVADAGYVFTPGLTGWRLPTAAELAGLRASGLPCSIGAPSGPVPCGFLRTTDLGRSAGFHTVFDYRSGATKDAADEKAFQYVFVAPAGQQ